ncbi:N-formylglutamate deformylase, partial [hydrothermal vent metagenome]
PVVFAFAHSGRNYPDHFLRRTQLDLLTLRSSEDAYVDQLFERQFCPTAQFVHALFPRAWLDANRHPQAIDPDMFHGQIHAAQQNSPQVRAGFGVIPKTVAHGRNIFSRRLDANEIEARLQNTHTPYHRALETALQAAQAKFGWALLVDCHSMPGVCALRPEQEKIDIVLGDRHESTCHLQISQDINQAFSQQGLVVAHNAPYAGGYSIIRHGQPQARVHAIQVEISRALYMDEVQVRKHDGFAGLQQRISKAMQMIGKITEPCRG